jgi:pyruvate formate lyase activating enzyme
LIPGENDSDANIKRLSLFLANIDENIPLHFKEFRPAYRMVDKKITSKKDLLRAVSISRDMGLKYVYIN